MNSIFFKLTLLLLNSDFLISFVVSAVINVIWKIKFRFIDYIDLD